MTENENTEELVDLRGFAYMQGTEYVFGSVCFGKCKESARYYSFTELAGGLLGVLKEIPTHTYSLEHQINGKNPPVPLKKEEILVLEGIVEQHNKSVNALPELLKAVQKLLGKKLAIELHELF